MNTTAERSAVCHLVRLRLPTNRTLPIPAEPRRNPTLQHYHRREHTNHRASVAASHVALLFLHFIPGLFSAPLKCNEGSLTPRTDFYLLLLLRSKINVPTGGDAPKKGEKEQRFKTGTRRRRSAGRCHPIQRLRHNWFLSVSFFVIWLSGRGYICRLLAHSTKWSLNPCNARYWGAISIAFFVSWLIRFCLHCIYLHEGF